MWGKEIRFTLQIFVGIIILISLIQIMPFKEPIIKNVLADSNWTQTTDTDFSEGALNYVVINGTSVDAQLELLKPDWFEKTPDLSPCERTDHSMATVYGDDKVILFGGYDGESELHDTWTYDHSDNQWTNMNPSSNPSGRKNHAMATIYNTDKVVLFGGKRGSYTYFNDTWVYDLSDNQWTNMYPSLRPLSRSSHDIAAIYDTDKILLFGGWLWGTGSLNDTWIYDFSDNQWINTNSSTHLPPTNSHDMTIIYGDDKIMMFGGSNLDDTWVYDLSDNQWTNMNPASKPAARSSHAMATIKDEDKIVLFGGWSFGADRYDDTWIYDFSDNQWTEITPVINPSGRDEHAMATIDVANKIIFFGGWDGFRDNETWTYSHGYFEYVTSGSYISTPYDTSGDSNFHNICWTADSPSGTSMKFQLRTAPTKSMLESEDFVGHDGTPESYYTSSGQSISVGHSGDIWIQYIAYLYTVDISQTPKLKNVTIAYNNLPSVIITTPEGEQHGQVTIEYELFDFDTIPDNCDLIVEFSTNNMNFSIATQGSSGNGIKDLTTSPTGILYTYEWASDIDLQGIDDESVYLKITPKDMDIGISDTTQAFHVDNNDIPIVTSITTSGESDDITITFDLLDTETDICDLIIEYQGGSVGTTWTIATIKESTSRLISGSEKILTWQSKTDEANQDAEDYIIRITPSDNDKGISRITEPFHIDNIAPTITSVSPKDKSIRIGIDENISVAFSEPMLRSQAESAFSITPETDGVFIWDNNMMIFNPISSLMYNIRYTVSIDNTSKDIAGNSLEPPYIWNFTTIKLDTDNDGIPDDDDSDDDNDGFLDDWEEFLDTNPQEPNDKPQDTDGDGSPDGDGTNSESWMDTDDDNDGFLDDWEEFLDTDTQEPNDKPQDTDGDGSPDGDVTNSESWMDTDDDNDGYLDEHETFLGTDTKDETSKPLDTDGDGLPDGDYNNSKPWMDFNDDNDGYNDNVDAYPLDFDKWEKEKKNEFEDNFWLILIILLVIIITIIVIISILFYKKKPKKVKEKEIIVEIKKPHKTKQLDQPELRVYGPPEDQYQALYGTTQPQQLPDQYPTASQQKRSSQQSPRPKSRRAKKIIIHTRSSVHPKNKDTPLNSQLKRSK